MIIAVVTQLLQLRKESLIFFQVLFSQLDSGFQTVDSGFQELDSGFSVGGIWP